MLFFSAIFVFFSPSLRLRGDFSLRLQAEDMGKKAQSDSLYRSNTYFTFDFKMTFSMTTIRTIAAISNSVTLPLYCTSPPDAVYKLELSFLRQNFANDTRYTTAASEAF
jgi:hypothetical protein